MDLSVMESFVAVVEEGSFSAAARRLGLSKSLTSKRISDLEALLGVRLLARSTRSVSATGAGREYYQRLKGILGDLTAAHEAVRQQGETPRGRLRIAAPVTYTRRVLQPALNRFMQEYPEVELEVVLDDGPRNLVEEGLDAAVVAGALEDSSLYARRLRGTTVHVVATPAYLDRAGRPARPSDLEGHRILHYTNLRTARGWPFRCPDGALHHQKIVPAFSANNGDVIRDAALEGLGIAFLPEFLISDALASGRLEPLLVPFGLPEVPIHLVYPHRKHASAALRAFLDLIAAEVAPLPR